MTSKSSALATFVSILLNVYLLYCGPIGRESADAPSPLKTIMRETLEMQKTEGDAVEGYYLFGGGENWPPEDARMTDGILIWHFDRDGSARNISMSPAQRWKNEGGKIYIQWPSEEYKHIGRFDGEYLIWNEGGHQDYFFKAE